MLALDPLTAARRARHLAHAWIIPELYAFRGASVVRRKGEATRIPSPSRRGCSATCWATTSASSSARTGLALEPGELGIWLVGEGGALLVRAGRQRVHCFCVGADADLPPSDRIAHLLLALRTDESGFATVANHAFAGAPWRLGAPAVAEAAARLRATAPAGARQLR